VAETIARLCPNHRLQELIGELFGRRVRGHPKPQDLPPAVTAAACGEVRQEYSRWERAGLWA
jgi:hypothetical protein